ALAPPALQTIYEDVTHNRSEGSVLALLVIEVYCDCGVGDFAHSYVPEIEIFEKPAAQSVILKAYCSTQDGTVKVAVIGEDVAHAARYFAADCDAAVTVLHSAVAYDDVL